MSQETNEVFEIAKKFVQYTQQHIFLTGKAGTGKTTFLQHIKQNCNKKMAVLAPTGVAAINAGGVTIHSFFQLPFGLFISNYRSQWGDQDNAPIHNANQLLKRLKFNANKRKLINELELLIIDEISMVRADIIDAIDTVLQFVRRKQGIPFGGVQMLFIGDLYQLPPVIKEEERALMLEYYQSPFFFDAHALKNEQPVYIELKKIYRQDDDFFIQILNNIRNNKCSESDLEILHDHYNPVFEPSVHEKFITLTTHNYIADDINKNALAKLPSETMRLEAKVTGDFPDHIFPIDKTLELKVGAQVMFIKNDKGEQRKYYNGKLATVEAIDKKNNQITVAFANDNSLFTLDLEVWNNVKYKFDVENNTVEEDVIGTFTQFPLRLAWAVTIHKSQGLTFEKAVIDAGKAFAAGQVYVALSRLTNLDGLVIKSRITAANIMTDPQIQIYCNNQLDEDGLRKVLSFAQISYIENAIQDSFNLNSIQDMLDTMEETYGALTFYNEEEPSILRMELVQRLAELRNTGFQFQRQIQQIVKKGKKAYPDLLERVEKGSIWFQQQIRTDMQPKVENYSFECSKKSKSKKFFKDIDVLKNEIHYKMQQFDLALFYANGLLTDLDPDFLIYEGKNTFKFVRLDEASDEQPASSAKMATHDVSYKMYLDGKTAEEIANERGMVLGTIEGHLIKFVETGALDVTQFVSEDKWTSISLYLAKNPEAKLGEIKEHCGIEATFTEIRATLAHLKYLATKK